MGNSLDVYQGEADRAYIVEWIANFFRGEREKWGKIIREVGVKPE